MSDVRRSAAWLADKLTDQERRLSLVESRKPGLANSSIEDGAIEEYTADGTFASSVGKQPDGSHIAFPATGPTPAAPDTPTIKAFPGGAEIRWNGKFAGGAVSSLDFKHVGVHIGTTPAVDTTPSSQVATIRGELGDVATIAATEGMLYVCFVAWTAAGKASAPSAVAAVAIPAPANAELISEALTDLDLKYDGVISEAAELDGRLVTAEEELTESTGRLTTAEDQLTDAFGQLGTVDTRINTAKTATLGTAAADAQTKADAARDFAASIAAQAINVIPDPVFAALDEYWRGHTLYPYIQFLPDATAHRGAHLLQMTAQTSSLVQVASSYKQPVTQGQVWEVSAWVRVSGALPTTGDVRLAVITTNSTGGVGYPTQATLAGSALTTSWQQIKGTYTVGAGIEGITFRVRLDGATTTGVKVQISDVSMQDTTALKAALDAAAIADGKAAAAQTLAGTADSNATAALTMAGSKSRVYYSTAVATGTGAGLGDLWRQRNASNEVIAEWQWSGTPPAGSWVKQTVSGSNVSNMDVGFLTAGAAVMSQALIDKLVAGTASFQRADIKNLFVTSGTMDEAVITKLWTDVVNSRKITTTMMAVGSFDNVITDPDFTNTNLEWGGVIAPYSYPPTDGRTGGGALKIAAGTGQNGRYSVRIPASGDAVYRVSVWVKSDVAIPAGAIGIYTNRKLTKAGAAGGAANILKQADGITAGNDAIAANTWTLLTALAVVDKSWYDFAIGFYKQTSFTTGTVWFSEPMATRMNAGELTVDGTVTAKQLATVIVLTSEIIAGNPLGTHTKLNPNGLRVMAIPPGGTEPAEVVRLGTDTDDYFGIVDATGKQVASFTSAGNMTAVAGEMETLTLGGTSVAEMIDGKGGELLGWASRGNDGAFLAGTTEHPYLSLQLDNVIGGRAYMVSTSPIHTFSDTANSDAVVRLHYVTGVDRAATVTDPVISEGLSLPASWSTGTRQPVTFNRIVTPSASGNMSLLLGYAVQSSGRAKITASGAKSVFLTVQDMGWAVPETGEARNGTANAPSGGTGGGEITPPAVKKNYDRTWYATGTRSFLGSGGTYNFNTNLMYSGPQPGTSNGDLSSMAVFSSDLWNSLAGSTVTEVLIYVYYDFWYYGSGGDAYIGLHGQTGLTASRPAKTYSHALSANWPRASGRWIKVPTAGWAAGTHKGFTLGFSGGGLERYGYAHDARIRVKYTK